MTAKLSILMAAAFIWSHAASATPVNTANEAAQNLSAQLGRDLSTAEINFVQERVAEVAEAASTPRLERSAATSTASIRDYFICTGGKAAYAIGGKQGLKCMNVFNAKSVTVTFNGESGSSLASGLSANQYVGINAGISANLSFMIVDHPPGQSLDGGYGFNTPSDHLTGAMASYSFGMTGVLYGLFFKNDSVVFIGGWQPGLGFEGGFSDIRIATEN